MVIRIRKGRKAGGPNMAFATNMRSTDPDGPCPRRWGTRIGLKILRQTRMRMPGHDERARVFCFVVSPVARNARIMLHPCRRAIGDSRRIPTVTLRTIILLEVCSEPGVQPRSGPPGKPPRWAAIGSPHLGYVEPGAAVGVGLQPAAGRQEGHAPWHGPVRRSGACACAGARHVVWFKRHLRGLASQWLDRQMTTERTR